MWFLWVFWASTGKHPSHRDGLMARPMSQVEKSRLIEPGRHREPQHSGERRCTSGDTNGSSACRIPLRSRVRLQEPLQTSRTRRKHQHLKRPHEANGRRNTSLRGSCPRSKKACSSTPRIMYSMVGREALLARAATTVARTNEPRTAASIRLTPHSRSWIIQLGLGHVARNGSQFYAGAAPPELRCSARLDDTSLYGNL